MATTQWIRQTKAMEKDNEALSHGVNLGLPMNRHHVNIQCLDNSWQQPGKNDKQAPWKKVTKCYLMASAWAYP